MLPPILLQTSLGDGLIAAGARLVELDLSDNAFGPAGVTAIRVLLTSPVCYSLRVLKLNNNGLGIGGGKVGVRLLGEYILFVRQRGDCSLGVNGWYKQKRFYF